MTCLHLHASSFPMHAKLKQQQQHHVGMEHTTKLLWGEPSMTNPHCKSFSSASSLRTKAIPDFIVVAATSPPKPRDPSTFLPIRFGFFYPLFMVSQFINYRRYNKVKTLSCFVLMLLFIHCSLLLVSVYFISNFVVPDILTKYFGFDKVNEEKKVDDDVEDE